MIHRGAPLFEFDKRVAGTLKTNLSNSKIVGIDESGRGPWAGPVLACAVYLPVGFFHPEIADSKLIPPKKRTDIYKTLIENAPWAIGIVDVDLIDSLNIARATHLAMKKALEKLILQYPQVKPDLILIDGLPLPKLGSFNQKSIVKGDRISASIAAASIIAKVERDKIMDHYDKNYPLYGFKKHKGYGTKLHANKLKELGPSPLHRKSFSPVLTALKKHHAHQ